MIDTDFLVQLKRFSIIVNKKVTSSFSGSKRSNSFGRGLVVNDFRPYVAGDDFRAIDWKIYARTDDLYIKRYEEDKALTVHVLIDISKSMDYGTGKHTKFEYAAMMGLGFAYLAARGNERFVLSTFADDFITFRAKRGMSQVMGFLHHLNNVKCDGVIDFENLMKRYKKTIKSRSLIIIISDFLFDIEQVKNTFPMYKNHEIRAIQILDRSEIDFDIRGNVVLQDTETKKEIETYLSEARRQEIREKLYEHILRVEKETTALGGSFTLLSPEQPVFESFHKVLNK